MSSMVWDAKDVIKLSFRNYAVGKKVALYDMKAGQLEVTSVSLEVGKSFRGLVERLTAEVAKIECPSAKIPERVTVYPDPVMIQVPADTLGFRMEVAYGEDTQKPDEPLQWETAISNRVEVTRHRMDGTTYIQHHGLGFIDYKSQDITAVKAAQMRDPRFREFRHCLMKTGNSFHGYASMSYDEENGESFPTVENIARSVLIQKDVIDLNWAMLCILRKTAFLRVTQNFKGPIDFIEGAETVRFVAYDNGTRITPYVGSFEERIDF